MAVELTDDDRRALVDLSHSYATNADRRDFDRLGQLFASAGELVTSRGSRRGRAEIIAAMAGLLNYDRTFHLLGQIRHWVETDETVAGEVYCIAHHFTREGGDTLDRVMYICYLDRYEHTAEGWRFARRELDVVWAGQEDKRS